MPCCVFQNNYFNECFKEDEEWGEKKNVVGEFYFSLIQNCVGFTWIHNLIFIFSSSFCFFLSFLLFCIFFYIHNRYLQFLFFFYSPFFCVYAEGCEEEDLILPVRYYPESLSGLSKATKFSEDEIKRMYRSFKASCPTGFIKEETFKEIYSQFFPFGGLYAGIWHFYQFVHEMRKFCSILKHRFGYGGN